MKAILLDANLLVLLVIGAVDVRWIGKHKRVKAFELSDWQLLLTEVGDTPIVTTPHILTEASNLLRSGGLTPAAHSRLMAGLADFIASAREEFIPARSIAVDGVLLRLGLTDAVIDSLARPDMHLLTTDLDLYSAALRRGQPATNFNHLRDMGPRGSAMRPIAHAPTSARLGHQSGSWICSSV